MDKGNGRRWCFTIHKRDVETTEWFLEYYGSINWGVFGTAQLEVCPDTGRLHIQGFVVCAKNQRMSAMKKLHSTAHWELSKGSLEQCEAYCSKDETRSDLAQPRTWGERPVQGKRTDLAEACDIVRNSIGNSKKRLRDLADTHPEVIVKYARGIQLLSSLYEEVPDIPLPSNESLYPWQQDVLSKLRLVPDNRKIIWVYDPEGNKGKSTLANICLIREFRNETIILEGDVASMAYAYDNERIVFFDVTRTQAENLNHLYSFAEQLKNGRLFSRKYESRLKLFNPPHVVFLSNSPPDYSKWTYDRYDVMTISEIFNNPL